jgi:hypothetical protein
MRPRIRNLMQSTLGLLAFGLGVRGRILHGRQALLTLVPPSNIPADAMASFQLGAETWDII